MGPSSKDPFAARVLSGMRRRAMTLRGFCRAVALDPSFVSKVLSGKRSPPSEEAVLRRIAGVLDLDAVDLIVSAGRIPAEWRSLWRDERLFKDIHALATGAAVETAPEPPPLPPDRGRSRFPSGHLAEELL